MLFNSYPFIFLFLPSRWPAILRWAGSATWPP